jgi:hypothetical protein
MCATPADQPAPSAQPSSPGARKPMAIFVCHGMGQQVHFETIEGVVNALLREEGSDAARAHEPAPFFKRLIARLVRAKRRRRNSSNITYCEDVYYWVRTMPREKCTFMKAIGRLSRKARLECGKYSVSF